VNASAPIRARAAGPARPAGPRGRVVDSVVRRRRRRPTSAGGVRRGQGGARPRHRGARRRAPSCACTPAPRRLDPSCTGSPILARTRRPALARQRRAALLRLVDEDSRAAATRRPTSRGRCRVSAVLPEPAVRFAAPAPPRRRAAEKRGAVAATACGCSSRARAGVVHRPLPLVCRLLASSAVVLVVSDPVHLVTTLPAAVDVRSACVSAPQNAPARARLGGALDRRVVGYCGGAPAVRQRTQPRHPSLRAISCRCRRARPAPRPRALAAGAVCACALTAVAGDAPSGDVAAVAPSCTAARRPRVALRLPHRPYAAARLQTRVADEPGSARCRAGRPFTPSWSCVLAVRGRVRWRAVVLQADNQEGVEPRDCTMRRCGALRASRRHRRSTGQRHSAPRRAW
jgi:hypothetical protein